MNEPEFATFRTDVKRPATRGETVAADLLLATASGLAGGRALGVIIVAIGDELVPGRGPVTIVKMVAPIDDRGRVLAAAAQFVHDRRDDIRGPGRAA